MLKYSPSVGFFQGFPTVVKSVESILQILQLKKKSQNLKLANQNDPEI